MSQTPIIVNVDRGISDLVPLFLEQRKADQLALTAAIASEDWAAVRHAAHGMAGAGASYGFDRITELGDAMVEAGRNKDLPSLIRLKAEFDDYMARLVVNFM